jgi:peptidoglycan L-alanyl-D-glutamate endopeptidase CwlK
MLELCLEAGIALLVTQGLRTWEQQDHLYAKGRTTPPLGKQHIITYAKGGQSYHNFGLAFDVIVLDANGKANWDIEHPSWKRIGEIGKSVSLVWGGDWKTLKDLPHFEYTCDVSLKACRDLYPSGLETIWSQII